MAEPRSFFSSVQEFQDTLNIHFTKAFGMDINAFFKSFTTNSSGSLVAPKYEKPNISGIISSRNLNPFGFNTTFEGLVHGTGMVSDLEGDGFLLERNKEDIRTYGVKTPLTFVGWGYDIFGYPAPNEISGWNASGVYATGNVVPTFKFAGSGTRVESTGTYTPYEKWRAGPLDIRWDNIRKVWTGQYGLYPAIITEVFKDNVTLTDFNTPVEPEKLTYSAHIYDGISSGIVVTGVVPKVSRPKTGTYKVYPISTGNSCIITHCPDTNGRPAFGIFAWETPYAEFCSSDTSSDGVTSSLDPDSILDNLLDNPLPTIYGGVGHNLYGQDDILIGEETGELSKKTLIGMSGIAIDSTSVTGKVIISISSGVEFTFGNGVNTSITAISGLTTPLSIGQGGTGSSVKNFVDLSNGQSVSGIKTFISTVRLFPGTSGSPSLSFHNATNYGLNYSNNIISIISSGISISNVYSTGTVHNQSVLIAPTENYFPSLIVRQRSLPGFINATGALQSFSSDIQQWQNASGNNIAGVTASGVIYSQGLRVYATGTTKYIDLYVPSSTPGNYNISFPTGNGRLALSSEITGGPGGTHTHVTYKPSGIMDGINAEFTLISSPNPADSLQLFKNGLLQYSGAGDDFILASGNIIVFNQLGNVPVSGDKLISYYII